MVSLPRCIGTALLWAACILHTCGARELGAGVVLPGDVAVGRVATRAPTTSILAVRGGAAQNATGVGMARRELGECEQACTMNRQMLSFTNGFRKKSKKRSLCLSSKLIAAARVHSEDMSKTKKLSHTGSDGSLARDRVRDEGFSGSRVGENTARGYSIAKAVFNAWKVEEGHKREILGDYTHTGAYKAGPFWTQVFAKSTKEGCDK